MIGLNGASPIIFMAPGQGSQFPGMARELYLGSSVFREHLDWAIEQAPREIREFVQRVVLRPEGVTDTEISDCRLTHPLVFIVHYALGKTLMASGVRADVYLGYSLGELTSCALGSWIPFESALKMALDAGSWIAERSPEMRMIAILSSQDILHDLFPIFEESEIGCVNYSHHFVAVVPCEQVELISKNLQDEKIPYQLLPIRRGFHSSVMESFRQFSQNWEIGFSKKKASAPIISCNLQRSIKPEDMEKGLLGATHRSVVQFENTIRQIEQSSHQPHYLDLSLTGTLSAFLRKILPRNQQNRIHTIASRFGDESKAVEAFKSTCDILTTVG
jgi:bacillaene synthase trans-acting acyltransferase